MNCLAPAKSDVTPVGMECQQPTHSAEDFFITVSGTDEPFPFLGLENAVDEIAALGMQILRAQNVLSPLGYA